MRTPELEPFHALRYTAAAGDAASLLAPPYDVISDHGQAELSKRSPHNIVRLERPEPHPDDRPLAGAAERAAAVQREWLSSGILARDPQPALYLYEQTFTVAGTARSRRAFFARVRLQPFAQGGVLPHEKTHAGPVEGRVALLGALQTQVSPILSMYRATAPLRLPERAPDVEATVDDVGHRLWAVAEPDAQAPVLALPDGPLYIADGHHRYTSALAYRDACRKRAASWTGDEPENFIMMALVATDDLVVLPTHRLIHEPVDRDGLRRGLEECFALQPVAPAELDERLRDAGADGLAFGVLGLEPGRGFLLTVRDRDELDARLPADRSPAWRSLDVAVLREAVMQPLLELDDHAADRGLVSFRPAYDEARAAVDDGAAELAFVLNPTPVEQVLAVADAGEVMPQKSTYFYPKLTTGLVMYPFA